MNELYKFYNENKSLKFPESFIWFENFLKEFKKEEWDYYSRKYLIDQAYEILNVEKQDLTSFFKSILNYFISQSEWTLILSEDKLYEVLNYLIDKCERPYVLNFIRETLEQSTTNIEYIYIGYPEELENKTHYKDEPQDRGEFQEEQFTLAWLDYHDGERLTIPGEILPVNFDEYPAHETFDYEIRELILSEIDRISGFVVRVLENDQKLDLVQKLGYIRDIKFLINVYFSKISAENQLILEYHKMNGYFSLIVLENVCKGKLILEQLKMQLQKVMPANTMTITENKLNDAYPNTIFVIEDLVTSNPITEFETVELEGQSGVKVGAFRIFEVNKKELLTRNYLLTNYFLKTIFSVRIRKSSFERLIDGFEKALEQNKLTTVYVKGQRNAVYTCEAMDEELEAYIEENNYQKKQVYLLQLNEEYLCYDGKDIFNCSVYDLVVTKITLDDLPF